MVEINLLYLPFYPRVEEQVGRIRHEHKSLFIFQDGRNQILKLESYRLILIKEGNIKVGKIRV
jgi:hypothetical protein